MKNWSKTIFKIAMIVFCAIVISFSPVLSSEKKLQTPSEEVFSFHSIDDEFGSFDPYADYVIEAFSIYYSDGKNALGETDGIYARIYSAYGAGYITLDMGKYEEILNGTGDDFSVISTIGNYSCWVGNYLESYFTMLGNISSGITGFDLSSANFSSARYVRIQYCSEIYVELDSIEAVYHNTPDEDNESPIISGPGDFWIWDNQTSINLDWSGSDLTPFMYSIVVNQEERETGEWGEDDISFIYFWTEIELQNVTLTLYDVYGNLNIDTVLIEILDTPAENTGSNFIMLVSSTLGLVGIVSISKKLKTR